MWDWEGDGPRMECSGYYFHLSPLNLMLGVGIHMFPKEMHKVYRDSVVDPRYGSSLKEAITEVSKEDKYSIGGKHYKRVPRGYDPENENAELLLYNGLHVGYENDIPEEFYSAALLDFCFREYQDLYPVHN